MMNPEERLAMVLLKNETAKQAVKEYQRKLTKKILGWIILSTVSLVSVVFAMDISNSWWSFGYLRFVHLPHLLDDYLLFPHYIVAVVCVALSSLLYGWRASKRKKNEMIFFVTFPILAGFAATLLFSGFWLYEQRLEIVRSIIRGEYPMFLTLAFIIVMNGELTVALLIRRKKR